MSTIILAISSSSGTFNSSGYLLAGNLAFLILDYLVYSLVKPEKF